MSEFEKETKYQDKFIGQAFGLVVGEILDFFRNTFRYFRYLIKLD
ncbi:MULTISPECIES: hypothetical protein [Clostridium]|nr:MULTISPECIES: hypothetical protein [Clostridium]